jgi:cytochrome c oxidase assembly factor CtaG
MTWAGWSIEPPLAYVALAALLYGLGGRGRAAAPREPLRTAAFTSGLATIVLALDSPIDGSADRLFWVHMFQHVLLLTVAPPLILLGRPWPRMWRALPLRWRAMLGKTLAGARFTAPLRRLARPWPAWLLFNATIVVWHVPGAYDATLTSGSLHLLEHAMFFFAGLLFWARVIDPGPLRPRLHWPLRVAYVVGAMVVGWGLAIAIVLAPDPLYPHYAELAQRPGGISALTDQQIAAGIMWVPGSLAYGVAMLIGFYRWLEPDSGKRSPRPVLTN